MATMYLMVGISGAGKTTWARTRMAGAEYFGSDGIRMELFGRELTLKGYRRVHRIMNQRMRAALEQGRAVVVDSVHLSRRARRRVLRAVPEGVRCVAVWIDTGVMQAIRNDACRQRHVPFFAIALMRPRLVEPKQEEGFHEIWRIPWEERAGCAAGWEKVQKYEKNENPAKIT